MTNLCPACLCLSTNDYCNLKSRRKAALFCGIGVLRHYETCAIFCKYRSWVRYGRFVQRARYYKSSYYEYWEGDWWKKVIKRGGGNPNCDLHTIILFLFPVSSDTTKSGIFTPRLKVTTRTLYCQALVQAPSPPATKSFKSNSPIK